MASLLYADYIEVEEMKYTTYVCTSQNYKNN